MSARRALLFALPMALVACAEFFEDEPEPIVPALAVVHDRAAPSSSAPPVIAAPTASAVVPANDDDADVSDEGDAEGAPPRISFPFGGARVVLPSETIEGVVERAKSDPHACISVEGHADKREPDPDGLAKKRAEATLAILVAHGLSKERLASSSYGSLRPVSPLMNPWNARVEFLPCKP